MAPRRSERPNDFASTDEHGCPFCAGYESETPPEIDAIHDNNGEWLTRTVPNRYPAFESPHGEHEVIIESPRHITRFVDLAPEEASAAVQMWARRIAHWQADPEYGYQLVFKNEGSKAGASLEHVHSQVVALPEPLSVDRPQPSAEFEVLACDDLIVAASSEPRYAFETTLRHADSKHAFTGLAEDINQANQLAQTLCRTLRAVRSTSGSAAYNLVVNSPSDGEPWWIDVVPRTAVTAGFELATGMWINTTPPEHAAPRLREALSTP